MPTRVGALDYIPILALGMVCALVGIAIMRRVTLTEDHSARAASRVAPAGLRRVASSAGFDDAGRAVVRTWRRGVVEAPYTLTHVTLLVVLKRSPGD